MKMKMKMKMELRELLWVWEAHDEARGVTHSRLDRLVTLADVAGVPRGALVRWYHGRRDLDPHTQARLYVAIDDVQQWIRRRQQQYVD